VDYALRGLKPVLDGDASEVDIKEKAERDYAYWVQDALSKRVWNASCISARSPNLILLSSDVVILIPTQHIGT
jgi:hypothetical protein